MIYECSECGASLEADFINDEKMRVQLCPKCIQELTEKLAQAEEKIQKLTAVKEELEEEADRRGDILSLKEFENEITDMTSEYKRDDLKENELKCFWREIGELYEKMGGKIPKEKVK